MTTEELAQVVEEELRRAQERIQARLDAACETSESAVLGVGTSLRSILDKTRDQAEDLTQLGQHLAGAAGTATLVAETSQMTRKFVGQLAAQLAAQEEAISAATATMKRILAAGARLGEVAAASRFLALNALIEANRLGPSGGASRVIAKEMQELASAAAQANTLVADLASELTVSLPTVAAGAHGMSVNTGTFHGDVDRSLSLLDHSFAELSDATRNAVQASEARLQHIIETSHAALRNLQFQDPMAQELRQLAGCVDEARAPILAALGVEVEPPQPTSTVAEPILAAGELELF